MELDLTKEEDVVKLMSSAISISDWNNKCDLIKDANGGEYPPFWFKAVMLSEVRTQFLLKYG